jgi:hypothetical protein
MTIAEHAIVSGAYSTLIPTALTMKRDVSDLLDLWAHRDTPLLNRIKWGGGSGGNSREWISEHLGLGYVVTSAALTCAVALFVPATSGMGTACAAIEQLSPGTLLYAHQSGVTSGDGEMWMSVMDKATDATSVGISWLTLNSEEMAADTKLYIVGHFANEGSDPYDDESRPRSILSNNFTILRKDIKITGSQAATDMYAVSNEPTHQMAMRLLEMQFERERSVLYSTTQVRTTTAAGLMNGAMGFLDGLSANSYVDASTTTLTESTFNDLVAACWENGGTPNVFVGNVKQMRLFTDWDDSKIRTRPDARMGGHFITSYLTDTGLEVDLVPLRHAPVNLGFVLDTNLMTLIPKQGRKLVVEKLAKVGDYDRWQLFSEYTLEMRKYDQGAHGLFLELT